MINKTEMADNITNIEIIKNINRIKIFDSFTLKVLAVITMLIDHTGAILFPEIPVLRIIGRISFPIFCFLLVEGFFHTKNIRAYMMRLGIFALISEPFFDLGFKDSLVYTASQNVFFTLLIGMIMMYFMEKYQMAVFRGMILLVAMGVAYALKSDYKYMGILLIFFFYIYRERRIFGSIAVFAHNTLFRGRIEGYCALALIPILLYNNKAGKYRLKYLFYIFYPLHIFILFLISELR